MNILKWKGRMVMMRQNEYNKMEKKRIMNGTLEAKKSF